MKTNPTANLDVAGKKALKDFCVEMSGAMTRGEAERDFQRESIKDFADNYEIDKKILRKMARTYHKQNFKTACQEQEEFEAMYASIFKTEAVQ